jgi:hypothetical protein
VYHLCKTCRALMDGLQDAAHKLEEATRLLATPVNRNTPLFDAALLEVQRVREACRDARVALIRHRAEHETNPLFQKPPPDQL